MVQVEKTEVNVMATELQPRKIWPIGTILLFALTGVLYVAMLTTISFSAGGGEAAFSQAIAALFAVIGLWVLLALLLFAGAILGKMPRWSAAAAVIFVPVSGVAMFVAIDMCSRHIAWAVIVPIMLPLLIALYAAWARWPRFHTAFPAKQTSMIVWGVIFVLSTATFLLAL